MLPLTGSIATRDAVVGTPGDAYGRRSRDEFRALQVDRRTAGGSPPWLSGTTPSPVTSHQPTSASVGPNVPATSRSPTRQTPPSRVASGMPTSCRAVAASVGASQNSLGDPTANAASPPCAHSMSTEESSTHIQTRQASGRSGYGSENATGEKSSAVTTRGPAASFRTIRVPAGFSTQRRAAVRASRTAPPRLAPCRLRRPGRHRGWDRAPVSRTSPLPSPANAAFRSRCPESARTRPSAGRAPGVAPSALDCATTSGAPGQPVHAGTSRRGPSPWAR